MSNLELGHFGEKKVGAYLEKQGYHVVQYNYYSGSYEIDLIAQNNEYLVIVEVKTRREGTMVSGIEAITPAKQKRIRRCAQAFLSSFIGQPFAKLQPRFDVAQVIIQEGDVPKAFIDYYENAF